MKITTPVNIVNLKVTDPEFINYLALFMNMVTQVINGNLTFSDNFSVAIIPTVFTKINSDLAVVHNLNRIPYGYINIGSLLATQIFNGVSANTNQAIFVQSTVATTVNILIF